MLCLWATEEARPNGSLELDLHALELLATGVALCEAKLGTGAPRFSPTSSAVRKANRQSLSSASPSSSSPSSAVNIMSSTSASSSPTGVHSGENKGSRLSSMHRSTLRFPELCPCTGGSPRALRAHAARLCIPRSASMISTKEEESERSLS
ncbi:hypothetical protein Dimus_016576 [Dionaea muscipula]